MKKMKFLPLLLMLVVVIFSCGKEVDSSVQNKNLTVEAIIDISDDFVESQKRTKDVHECASSSNRFAWQELLIIASADIIGGTIGTIFGGPVGGIIGGAGCSSVAYDNYQVSPPPPPNNEGVGNASNAYDFGGELHVNILHQCITEESDFIFNEEGLIIDNYVQVANNLLISNGTISAPMSFTENDFNSINEYVNTAKSNANNVLSVIYSNMDEDGYITTEESEILASYFYALENSNSFASFLNYSIQVENAVIGSNLSSSTKEILLFTMATARHDINYWNN